MSEYQYFEFIAVDRPLTSREMDHLRSLSSRARITPVSFCNDYSWGSPKFSPRTLVEKFFDVHVYFANWGDADFVVRLPKDAVEEKMLKPFCVSPYLELTKTPDSWLLTWSRGEMTDYERDSYVEVEGWLARLAPVREELLRGDLRSLYIGWLRALTVEDIAPDALEPLVLSGLDDLTPAQQALAELVEVDCDLLAGAGTGTDVGKSAAQGNEEEAASVWLDQLSRSEMTGYLAMMLNGQGKEAERSLRKLFAAWRMKKFPVARQCRTAQELRKLAESAQEKRLAMETKARRQVEAESKAKRKAWLDELARDFPQAWRSANKNAGKGYASAYDTACRQLVDLRDAYALLGAFVKFQQELQIFMAEHSHRRALMERLRRQNLVLG